MDGIQLKGRHLNKIMKDKIEKFFVWLVQSSSDPNKVALTVKAVFSLGVIQGIFALLPSLGIHPTFDLNTVGDSIYSIVYTGLNGVAAIAVFIGAVRKVWNTVVKPTPVVPPTPPVIPIQ